MEQLGKVHHGYNMTHLVVLGPVRQWGGDPIVFLFNKHTMS
jgi:hypothetical protein